MQVKVFSKGESCVPCKQLKEFLDKKGVSYEEVLAFDNPEVAIAAKVKSVPTTIRYTDSGEEVGRSVGFRPEVLEDLLGV